jgi:hypothetical protein
MTEDQAHAVNNNPADPSVPGRDATHLNAKGGEFFGAMVAREFAAAFPAVKVSRADSHSGSGLLQILQPSPAERTQAGDDEIVEAERSGSSVSHHRRLTAVL